MFMSVLTNSINLETAESYGPTFLGNWDLILESGNKFFPYPQHPVQLWGPPSLIPHEYQGLSRWR